MTLVGWSQIALVLALVVACAVPLSAYHRPRLRGRKDIPEPRARAGRARASIAWPASNPAREQDWFAYTIAMIVFSVAGFLSLYALQRLQNFLPLNPRGFDAVAPDLAFNTSSSFITNTNWQNYSGETTMSHLTQMLGLTVHNFVSAATGLAMAFALVRGFARSSRDDSRQFLGRCDPRHALHPPADLVRRRARLRRSRHAADAGRRGRRDDARRARSRPFRSGRSRARRSSRSSAPTAAASSTPMRRIRSRTPTPGPTCWRSGLCF